MLKHFANIKKLILLGFAVASTKVMLLLFAYFFNAETYNQFNQIYYTASIVILFGSLGFNIAITRVNVNIRLVTTTVLLTTTLTYFFLHIFSTPFENVFEIFSILVYCLFVSISGIYVFQLLFTGKYQDYFLLTVIYSILHLLIIPAILYLHLSLFTILPVVSILWFLFGFPRFIRKDSFTLNSFVEFYKIGLSAFVINSAVSLALAADKYFVNHFFSLAIANSYTFAWGLTAPMFYIGVLIEQYLFSETNTSKSNILKHGFILVSSLVLLYAISIFAGINFFPQIIPASVDYVIVKEIFTMMIIGYSLYVIVHFPVNAYLFKSLSTDKQKTISIAFAIIISGFLVVYILIFQRFISIDYILLLVITWSYIFTLFIVKIIIMFRKSIDMKSEKSVMEKSNLV